MPFGVSLRQYLRDFSLCLGSMLVGSQCVHMYMAPELTVQDHDFDAEHDSKKRAILEVQKFEYERQQKARLAES